MKSLLITFFTIFFTSFNAFTQSIETVVSHPKIADGLYVDTVGNVYTTSGGLMNGREIGKYDIKTGHYDPTFAFGFAGPINIAAYRDSLLIVTNYDNSSVYSYNINTTELKTMASGLDGPAGIAIDANDNIYITNWGQAPRWAGRQIHKISSDGKLSVFVDSPLLYRPQGITINHKGEIIFHTQKKLYRVNPTNGHLEFWTNVGHFIGNMTFRKKDLCIYGASNQGHKIIKIDDQAQVSVFAGSIRGYEDGDLKNALFNTPLGIAFTSSEDTLYIAEGGTVNRLRRILMNKRVNVDSEMNGDEIKIFPNPSKDIFNIILDDAKETIVEIFDTTGILVLSKTLNGKIIPLDLSLFPKGNYFIKLNHNGTIITKEIKKL